MIRWIPACVKIVSFYTNLILISCFLGLGIGCVLKGKYNDRSILRSFPFLMLLQLVVFVVIKVVGISAADESWGEKLWDWGKLGLIPSVVPPIIVFILNTATFIPIGRILGTLMERFRPLPGYSINIIGSTAGVSLLVLFNIFGTGPLAWFASGFALLMLIYWVMRINRTRLIWAGVLMALSLGVVAYSARGTIWSPYYQLNILDSNNKFFQDILSPLGQKNIQDIGIMFLSANEEYFQLAANLDPYIINKITADLRPREGDPSLQEWLLAANEYTSMPYKIHRPGQTLILGSGLGNDVAAAVRQGMTHIDAVEIDPVIADLGRNRHPENPYGRPNVTLHITDARRFVQRTEKKYDLIVYAFLDSHALFSSLSSVRLDNFVYTQEGFSRAARLLKPDGIMVVTFGTPGGFVSLRLFHLLNNIFPGKTYAWSWQNPVFSYEINGFIAGQRLDNFRFPADMPMKDVTGEYSKTPASHLPTDDWPFIYHMGKSITTDYSKILLLLLIISIIFTMRMIPQTKSIKLHFFLLGAGFLLLETKSITEISLLFGSTWIVNSVVIAAFLIMNFFAAIYIMIGKAILKIQWLYALLAALLVFNYFTPVSSLLLESSTATLLLGALFVSAPVFFSGAIFATSFRDTDNVPAALGSNLLGAVIGGFSEYFCLITGFKFLYLIAIIFYALSFLLRRK